MKENHIMKLPHRARPQPKGILRRVAATFLALAVGPLASLPALTGTAPTTAFAVESMSAAQAIGINTDAAPDDFDEADEEKNPYGKATVSVGGAQEVFVGNMGQSGGLIIGEGVSSAGMIYENSLTWRPEDGYLDTNLNNVDVKYFIKDIAVAGAPYHKTADGRNLREGMEYAKDALRNAGYDHFVTYSNSISDNSSDAYPNNAGSTADANAQYGRYPDYSIVIGYTVTTNINEAITDIRLLSDNGFDVVDKSPYNYDGLQYYPAKVIYHDEDNQGDTLKGQHGCLNTNAGGWFLYLIYSKTPVTTTSVGGFKFRRAVYNDLTIGFHNDSASSGVGSLKSDNGGESFYILQDHTSLNAGSDGPEIYLNASEQYLAELKPEGKQVSGSSVQQENAYVNKTAGGNFDGDKDDKKKYYAMVAYNKSDGSVQLSVVNADEPASSTTYRTICRLDTILGNMSTADRELSAAAMLDIATGDFDNNGLDEIAVYNPGEARIEIYAPTQTQRPEDMSNDTNAWVLKTTIGATRGKPVSLSVGDLNGDEIDDIAVALDSGVWVYHGKRNGLSSMSSNGIQIISNYTQENTTISSNFSATIFKTSENGEQRSYIATMGWNDNSYQTAGLAVFGYQHNKYVKLAETTCNSMFCTYSLENQNQLYSFLNAHSYQLELCFANGVLFSPYLSQVWDWADNTLKNLPSSFDPRICPNVPTPLWNCRDYYRYVNYFTQYYVSTIPYDLQVVDLNGNGVQTIFYKTFYALNSSTFSHYIGAVSPNVTDEKPSMSPRLCETNSTYPKVYAILDTDTDSSIKALDHEGYNYK